MLFIQDLERGTDQVLPAPSWLSACHSGNTHVERKRTDNVLADKLLHSNTKQTLSRFVQRDGDARKGWSSLPTCIDRPETMQDGTHDKSCRSLLLPRIRRVDIA